MKKNHNTAIPPPSPPTRHSNLLPQTVGNLKISGQKIVTMVRVLMEGVILMVPLMLTLLQEIYNQVQIKIHEFFCPNDICQRNSQTDLLGTCYPVTSYRNQTSRWRKTYWGSYRRGFAIFDFHSSWYILCGSKKSTFICKILVNLFSFPKMHSLHGTFMHGLHLLLSTVDPVVFYSNANWVCFSRTHRYIWFCVFLGDIDNLMLWSSKHQHVFSQSNVEDKFMR